MKSEQILDIIPQTNSPVGLSGCHSEQTNLNCCAYDIVIFDHNTNEPESIIDRGDKLFKIHHSGFDETRVEILIQLQNIQILSDDQWELKMFLAKLDEKQKSIYNAFTKNSIIEAQICLTKAKEGLNKSDPFVFSWIKSAGFYITDAILSLNNYRPSPSHMLNTLRNLESNKTNETLSLVLDLLGLERATPSLLDRMSKSAIGISDLIEKNGNSKIIQRKIDCLIEKSLFSDCYFYIGYTIRDNLYKIKNSLDAHPELSHILKTGFDLEYDNSKFERDKQSLSNITQILLKSTHE